MKVEQVKIFDSRGRLKRIISGKQAIQKSLDNNFFPQSNPDMDKIFAVQSITKTYQSRGVGHDNTY